MTKPPNNPCLDGRHGLNRADVPRALLRTLTDIYVQQPSHTLEEEQHYCELAHRLLDAVDTETRVAVAAILAFYPRAPAAIVERLRREGALRRDRDARPAHTKPVPDTALPLARASPHVDTAGPAPSPAASSSDDDFAGVAQLSAHFAAAASDERRLILLSMQLAATKPLQLPPPDAQLVAQLEMLALQRRADEFATLLARLLGIGHAQARAIVQDTRGECIVAAAKALSVPSEVLQRVLLFLNPAIGQSVQRVYDLVALYDEITVQAACSLVSIWQAADPGTARPARPPPGHWRDMLHHARSRRATARPSMPASYSGAKSAAKAD